MMNHVKLTSNHDITVDEQAKIRKIFYDYGIADEKAQNRLMSIE